MTKNSAQVIDVKQISMVPGLDIKKNQISWPIVFLYWVGLGKVRLGLSPSGLGWVRVNNSEEPRSPFSGSARTVPHTQFSMGAHHHARVLPTPKYYVFFIHKLQYPIIYKFH